MIERIEMHEGQEPRTAQSNRPGARESARAPGSLPEFKLYQPRAGHPDWPRLMSDARRIAGDLSPMLEPPVCGLREVRRRARSLATAVDSFVENSRRARAGREDLLPLYFIWTTHRACNFSCGYCDDHRGRKYPDLPGEGTLDTEQGKQLLRVMRTRATSVYFAGGEPTLRKDLPELTRTARDLDYYPIIVNTNASAISKQLRLPAWRGWLADVDLMVVSLDGLDLSMLQSTWEFRRPEDVILNLLVLRELAATFRVKLAVNCVVQPGMIEHARDVLDLANDLGIWFTPVPMNRGPGVAGGLHGDPAYEAFARLVLERKRQGYRITGSERMNRRLLRSEPLMCRNTLKPHVDFDGKLFWPCKASVDVAPLTVDVLQFTDVNTLWDHCTSLMDPKGMSDRCGAKCNWAQNYSTDAYAYGLQHPLSLLGEVGEFLGRS